MKSVRRGTGKGDENTWVQISRTSILTVPGEEKRGRPLLLGRVGGDPNKRRNPEKSSHSTKSNERERGVLGS